MKTIRHLLYLLIIPLLIISCNRDYDEPPLTEPVYQGSKENLITIEELKTLYSNVENGKVALVEPDYLISGYVTANDKSGNLFKQFYIQDGSGAIGVSWDQTNIFNVLFVGQEVFINIKELYITKYGDALQLGYDNPSTNRIPAAMLDERLHLNNWPNPNAINAKPIKADIGNLKTDMIGRLVQLDNVYFKNGGVNNVINDSLKNLNKYTEETISNANSKNIIVRTGSYANEFVGVQLPKGYGTLYGILGYYNGTWQLILRDLQDLNVNSFGGEAPEPEPEPENVFYFEKFGTGTKDLLTNKEKIKIADYTEFFDMKAPVTYTDPDGNLDIRATAALNNFVWYPKNADGNLKIEGINSTGKSNIKLTYEMTGNIFADGEQINVNALKVRCDGTDLNVPSFILTKDDNYGNKFYTVEINDLPAGFTSLEFYTTTSANTLGLRLANIKLEESNTIVPTPTP